MRPVVAPPAKQPRLFEWPVEINCHNTGSARNAYGRAAQEIVCALLELEEIRINGSFSTCFDAWKDGEYYEIKSVKQKGKLVIYDWRVEKEQAAGVVLYYAILRHDCRGERKDIIQKMADRPLNLMVVPADVVHLASAGCKLNKHKSGGYSSKRPGYNRAGYAEGYRNLPVADLEAYVGPYRQLENPFGKGIINYAELRDSKIEKIRSTENVIRNSR